MTVTVYADIETRPLLEKINRQSCYDEMDWNIAITRKDVFSTEARLAEKTSAFQKVAKKRKAHQNAQRKARKLTRQAK